MIGILYSRVGLYRGIGSCKVMLGTKELYRVFLGNGKEMETTIFYGCHAHPNALTCRARRPFWRVGAVSRYLRNPGELLSICLIPKIS